MAICLRVKIIVFVFSLFSPQIYAKDLRTKFSSLIDEEQDYCNKVSCDPLDEQLMIFIDSLSNNGENGQEVAANRLHLLLQARVDCLIEGIEFINSILDIPSAGDSLTPILYLIRSFFRDFFAGINGQTIRSEIHSESLIYLRNRWLEQERIYKWPAQIKEYSLLLELLLGEKPSESANRTFKRLEHLIASLNIIIEFLHPHLHLQQSRKLRSKFGGRGVRIAVFDLFDSEILQKQRIHYSNAKILDLRRFGDPVSLSHGNAVIDVILSLAPQATIIPITASNSSAIIAFRHMASAKKFQVLNISRPFIGDRGRVNQLFSRYLDSIGRKAIISKSMGNSGTDLNGNLSQRRQDLGLGIPGDLSAYDTDLIRDYVIGRSLLPKIFFVVNADFTGKRVALSATVPGRFGPIHPHSLALSGEGVFSPSNGVFESGSSFAAPQLSAIAALLFEAIANNPKKYPAAENPVDFVFAALQLAAMGEQATSESFGLGFLNGDTALDILMQK